MAERNENINSEKTRNQCGDEDSDSESLLEFDTSGCVPSDLIDEEMQPMGDSTKEVTSEEIDLADEKRTLAMNEFSSGNCETAIKLIGEAIKLNPTSALLFSKRGQIFLSLSKPNACIKDCTKALQLNCDSSTAYKYRGRAYRLLGEWQKSAQDLRQAAKIDYDDQTNEWLKEVQPNAYKIEMHQVKMQRRKQEKIEKEKLEHLKANRESRARPSTQTFDEETIGMANIYKLLQDPEIMRAFQDPEVEAAFKDISLNPANLNKYQNNPKIQAVIEKLTSKLGSSDTPNGIPNFGFGGPDSPATGTLPDDDTLD